MTRKTTLTALVSGLLFGIGLGISGMVKPEKLIGFLDVTGEWDPSLVLVMLGATVVHMLFVTFILKRPAPVFAEKFSLPTRKDIDARLIGGSMLFGVGWALGGLCPGPALVSLVSGSWVAPVFVVTMAVGMLLHRFLEPSRASAALQTASSAEEPPPRPVL